MDLHPVNTQAQLPLLLHENMDACRFNWQPALGCSRHQEERKIEVSLGSGSLELYTVYAQSPPCPWIKVSESYWGLVLKTGSPQKGLYQE